MTPSVATALVLSSLLVAAQPLSPTPPLSASVPVTQSVTSGPPPSPVDVEQLREVDLLPAVGRLGEPGTPEVPLGLSPDLEATPTVLERTVPTDGAAVVGVAWDLASSAQPTAQIRFGRSGVWDAWTDVVMEPTADEESAAIASEMSDGMVAAGADTVQIRLEGTERAPLTSARIVLVDGGEGPAWPSIGSARGVPITPSVVTATTTTAAGTVAPTILSRLWWGADESIARTGCESPAYGTQLDRFVVHHTAGSNSYSSGDVPAILRGIQNYHRQARGWCDIGYNILVDKFGRTFEGRRGGLDRLVVGVHAAGFNTNVVGLSVLGDYTKVAPTGAILSALAGVIGWKSYVHGFNPVGTSVKDGRTYRNVIGHREVASTACPGLIQGHLDALARTARDLMLGYVPAFSNVAAELGTAGTIPGKVVASVPTPVTWTATIRDASGNSVGTREGSLSQPGMVSVSFPSGDDGLQPVGTYTVEISASTRFGRHLQTSTELRLQNPALPPYSQMVASPDFTGDQVADLFTVDTVGRLLLHPGDDGGRVGAPLAYGTGWAALEIRAPGDWDGDGQDDLVAVNPSGALFLYRGVGGASFSLPRQIGNGWSGFRIVPAGDVNGDAVADLLAIDPSHRLWLYPGNGRGGFRTRVQVGNGWNGFDLHAAGDMNNDGRADILSIDQDGRLWFYAGRGGGYFLARVQVGHGWSGHMFASGGDFDRNGINDLMGRDLEGRVWFYSGRVGGTFTMKVQVAEAW